MRIPGLILLAALSAHAGDVAPFGIRVTDEITNQPVPMAVLETVHGLRYVSDSAGWIAFDEPGMVNRRVFFSVSSPGYTFPKDNFGFNGLALDAKAGATAEIKLNRLNIAERVYRVTGQGIYRDTTKLGKEAPLPYPNLDGGVLAQQGTQVALFGGKLWWLWGTTQRVAHPLGNVRGTVATSELPASGGLDPTQGVHLTYQTNDRDEPQAMLPGKEPGSFRFDGLVAVKDRMGAEHLMAHYEQIAEDGKRVEHGIVEWSAALHQFERVTVLGDEYAWQFPQGHAVIVSEEQRIYFSSPYALVRVPANYEAVVTPTAYEAFGWDEDKGEERWQQAQPPVTRDAEDRVIAKKYIKWAEAHLQLTDASNDKDVLLHSGSIRYSAYRKAWLLIGADEKGDVWFAQSAHVDGPWQSAVQIAMHGGKAFDEVMQLDALDTKDGRLVHFLGTITDESLPRYRGTQVMYRIDLDEPRLKPTK